MTRGELLRACDANANRASEALRVAEDVARFGWNDSHLSLACKALRHELAHVVETICPGHDRMSCRETQHDVGTVLTAPDEY
ncbi:MAG TPA: thiamine phosphate synthase, partial [Pirellulaceae bacterium]